MNVWVELVIEAALWFASIGFIASIIAGYFIKTAAIIRPQLDQLDLTDGQAISGPCVIGRRLAVS